MDYFKEHMSDSDRIDHNQRYGAEMAAQWIDENVSGDLSDWISRWLSDDDLEDEDLVDPANWDMEGAAESLRWKLINEAESGRLSLDASMTEVMGGHEGMGDLFTELMDEHFMNDIVRRRQHVEAGGAGALATGEL